MAPFHHHNHLLLDEAIARIMGESVYFHTSSVGYRAFLEGQISSRLEKFREVQASGNAEAVKEAQNYVSFAERKYWLAESLYTRLCGEVDKIRAGKPSDLILVEDSQSGDGYNQALLSKQSVLDWSAANNLRPNMAPVSDRTHSTPLLALLDELIDTFWEDVDPDDRPTNDHIKAYVREEYGDWYDDKCQIAGVSDKVLEAMGAIMRPSEYKRGK